MAATIENEFGPYLYPNQYINFTAKSAVVSKAASLAASADTDLDVVTNVYNYIIDNITYDYDKAKNVASGYLPDVDAILSSGSGKSTTLACLIDRINHEREDHIITLVDPLEFLHRHEKSIVSQREISTDTESYLTALRAALRQSPDVILLGEMVPAFEIMVLIPAIRNLIREGKVHQIDGIIYTSAAENMIAMDTSIYNLFKEGVIDRHTAVAEAVNPEIMAKRLNLN